MKTYNIKDNVDFSIYPGGIGVCVSGGLDSALLLYFTLKYTEEPIHIFSLASQEKLLRNTHASINVVNKCIELTGNYNLTHHISYVSEQTKENLFTLPFQFLNSNTISTIYTGITKNPPRHVTDSFTLPTLENQERDPTVTRVVKQKSFYMPWTNIDKLDLHDIYEKYNLMDTLYPVTRSCEWVSYTNWPDPGDNHCGKCWWCQERVWGFGKL
jgi:7-cyano-7-deazaguanine synthase in queuosine biosynthesis